LYFNQYGYDTIYLNHGGENRKNMKEIIRHIQFKQIFFNMQIKNILKEEAAYTMDYDYDDRQMMRALVKFLNKRTSKEKPFFVAISTIGTHTGLKPVDTNQNLKDLKMPESQFKALDNAMKIFFDYFFNSSYSKNTIVVLTGDHVYPKYSKKYNSTTFDDLALMIYTPWSEHKRQIANTSSIALAPTILQMANYPNKSNTFLGKSLFEENNNIAIGVSANNNICYNFKEKSRCKNISKETLGKITKYIFLKDEQ
jgi:phosphoglycerol transferase MdoB-like AlkP superfamily enzyme